MDIKINKTNIFYKYFNVINKLLAIQNIIYSAQN